MGVSRKLSNFINVGVSLPIFLSACFKPFFKNIQDRVDPEIWKREGADLVWFSI